MDSPRRTRGGAYAPPVILLFAACSSTPTLLLAPDATASGQGGGRGPWGAAQDERGYVSGATETVVTDVIWPAREDGSAQDLPGGWPTVVFVHGGDVAADRYFWLGAHLASRGYLVAMPHHPLDLAITATGNAIAALHGVMDDEADHVSGATAIGGHSLGGVIASWDWANDPAFGGLFLLASYPTEDTDVASRGGSPVLSIVGEEDGYAAPADCAAGAALFSDPVYYAEIPGMIHFSWVDDNEPDELAADGDPSRGTESVRTDGMLLIDSWLDGWLEDDADALATLNADPYLVTP